MTGRTFSLVAIPLALVGHLLFWSGSATLLRSWSAFGGGLDVGALLLVLGGIVLILAAVATTAIGPLGAIVVGAVQLLLSLAVHVFPFSFRGGFAPGYEILNASRSISMELGDGMYFYFPPGAGAVTGAILLGAGLASGRRLVRADGRTRLLSGLGGLVGVLGLVLAIAGGGGVYVRQLVMMSGVQVLDVVMLYTGVVLLGAVAYSTRWSSAGAFVAGGATTLVALVGLASPVGLSVLARPWPEFWRGIEIAAPSGILLLIGVSLLTAGVAARWRLRGVASSAAVSTPASV